jgi:hypothetical protein
MTNKVLFIVGFCAITLVSASTVIAQTTNIYGSQNFRLGEAHYRVAEVTQLADTVMVWGDIQLPGTYLVPRGISIAQLIAYARGPRNVRTSETDLDWSEILVEVTITNGITMESKQMVIQFDGTVSQEFFDTKVKNFDTIVVRVRRKATILDYVRAYSPIISSVLSTILLYRTIRNL